MFLDNCIDKMQEDIVAAIQACVQIESVRNTEMSAPGAPFGPGIQKALEWTLSLGEELGFTVKNIDGYIGYIEMGTGDLLGILGHIDVVPEGDGWSVPPYSGEIKDGKIFGRGTLDDKGPTLLALFAMKAIKDENIPLNMRVRLIIGTDEESGWEDIAYYSEREEIPNIGFTPDADFPIINAEKGILHLEFTKNFTSPLSTLISICGGNRANVVPDSCEVILNGIDRKEILSRSNDFVFPEGVSLILEDQEKNHEVKLTVKGSGAHGSLPQNGKNAVIYALQFLQTLPLTPPEKETINFILDHPGDGFYGEGLNVGLSDEVSGRLSLNLGIFELSSETLKFVIDIRYPVSFTKDDVFLPIQTIAQAEGYSLKIVNHQAPHYVTKDSKLVQALLSAYEDVTGLEPYTIAIGGGTYAKALPQGVAFGPVFPGDPDGVHCADEFIPIDKLLLTTKVYAQAILNLAAVNKKVN